MKLLSDKKTSLNLNKINYLHLKRRNMNFKYSIKRKITHAALCSSMSSIATKSGFTHIIGKQRNHHLPEDQSDHWFLGILVLPFYPACSTEEHILESRPKTAIDFPEPFTIKLVNQCNMGTQNTKAMNEDDRHHLEMKPQLSLTILYLPNGDNSCKVESCYHTHCGISYTLQSHLASPYRGVRKSRCWDAAKGGVKCKHGLRGKAVSLWSLALLLALRNKIIENSGAWLNRKDPQSLSWETGIHEAFLGKGGISSKGQSSWTPLQVKNIPSKEPENSTGARQGEDKSWTTTLRQDHLYGCWTSVSPWVWSQIIQKEKIQHEKNEK